MQLFRLHAQGMVKLGPHSWDLFHGCCSLVCEVHNRRLDWPKYDTLLLQTKNVAGRLLVGLRWWNEVTDEGSNWRFETLEEVASFMSTYTSVLALNLWLARLRSSASIPFRRFSNTVQSIDYACSAAWSCGHIFHLIIAVGHMHYGKG